MSEQEPTTRPCPLCEEEVKRDAVRCKHCQGTIAADPTSTLEVAPSVPKEGDCSVRPLLPPVTNPGWVVSYTRPRFRAETCPPAITDTDPEGHGLGVWVLVEATNGECVYEYAGGIV